MTATDTAVQMARIAAAAAADKKATDIEALDVSDALVITGQADSPVYLYVTGDGVSGQVAIRAADGPTDPSGQSLWGLEVSAVRYSATPGSERRLKATTAAACSSSKSS